MTLGCLQTSSVSCCISCESFRPDVHKIAEDMIWYRSEVEIVFSFLLLTAALGLPLWDSVAVQQLYGALGCRVHVLLFPGLVQIALRLQQPQGHMTHEHG